MNTVYRILIKIIIFLTTCNMLSILFDKGCYFTFGCALLVISFGVYEFLDTLFKYDNWGESMIPNDNGFVVYGLHYVELYRQLDGHELQQVPGIGDREAWHAAAHGVTKGWTRLSS